MFGRRHGSIRRVNLAAPGPPFFLLRVLSASAGNLPSSLFLFPHATAQRRNVLPDGIGPAPTLLSLVFSAFVASRVKPAAVPFRSPHTTVSAPTLKSADSADLKSGMIHGSDGVFFKQWSLPFFLLQLRQCALGTVWRARSGLCRVAKAGTPLGNRRPISTLCGSAGHRLISHWVGGFPAETRRRGGRSQRIPEQCSSIWVSSPTPIHTHSPVKPPEPTRKSPQKRQSTRNSCQKDQNRNLVHALLTSPINADHSAPCQDMIEGAPS